MEYGLPRHLSALARNDRLLSQIKHNLAGQSLSRAPEDVGRLPAFVTHWQAALRQKNNALATARERYRAVPNGVTMIASVRNVLAGGPAALRAEITPGQLQSLVAAGGYFMEQ